MDCGTLYTRIVSYVQMFCYAYSSIQIIYHVKQLQKYIPQVHYTPNHWHKSRKLLNRVLIVLSVVRDQNHA